MAEFSMLWTTGAGGDGASPYTQANWTDFIRRMFASDNEATEGVLAGFLGELAVSGTASPVSVAGGGAVVYGFPYQSTGAVNVAVPTPVVGTTGHRVVLRASWSAKTVRIALLSAADGVATPPAVTQSAGVTWEISLATLTITTGGVIAVADDREMCRGAMAVINRRLGGDAAQWNVSGSTIFRPGRVKIQVGVVVLTSGPVGAVTFPVPFTGNPLIFVTPIAAAANYASVAAISPEGFSVYASATGYYQWFAIGNE